MVTPSLGARASLAVQRALALRLSTLSTRAIRRIVGAPRVIDGVELDVQVQLLLWLAKRVGRKPHAEMGLVRARRELERGGTVLSLLTTPMARVADLATDGASRVPLRLYVPRALAGLVDAPALVYLHGGGFALGSRDSHDGLCRYVAEHTPCVVVSVEYRLAPEHKFPAAVDDSVAALRWVQAHAKELGIDPARIAIGGDSAGGNLSAVTCLEQKRDGVMQPRLQVLLYPATDLTRAMPSHRVYGNGFLLDRQDVDWFVDQYVRSKDDLLDPRGSPLFAKDFTGLPPALVVTAGFDVLRDEGEAYARKLEDAGVRVMLHRDPGMVHGYLSVPAAIDASRRRLDDVCSVVRRELSTA